jgi:uncharacterized protein YbjQ (UPF0145 family)
LVNLSYNRYALEVVRSQFKAGSPFCNFVVITFEEATLEAWVTTAFSFDGYRVTRQLGIVRGITVRSRSIVGNFVGGLQTLVGGNIQIYTELCERARAEAFDLMVQHARQMGANAIIGMRYDANEVMDGVTEVLAYGTAVVIEKE